MANETGFPFPPVVVSSIVSPTVFATFVLLITSGPFVRMKENITGAEVIVLTLALSDFKRATTLQEVTDVAVKLDPTNEQSPDWTE